MKILFQNEQEIIAELAAKSQCIFFASAIDLRTDHCSIIQGAPHRPDAFRPQDMGIDHGGGNVLVAEQFLHGADVGDAVYGERIYSASSRQYNSPRPGGYNT